MKKENEIKTVVPALRFPEFQDTEGWKEYKLKSLCEIGNGKDYKHLGSGNIPVYGSGGYMTSVDNFLYDGESVCIGRKGTIDKPIFLTGKFWTVDTLFYTHSFHNCLPKFLYLIFQQINWYKYNEAGGVPSLSKTTIGEINVFVPVEKKGDLKEQKKIAECLSSLDELIEATTQKVKALKEYKKGLMQRLFPVESKNVPDLRFPEFQASEKWKECSLDEYFNFKQGFQCPIEEQYDKQEHGMVRFIRIIDLTQPSTPYRYINDPGNQYYINKENLFMVRYGDPGLVGIGYEGIIANNLFQLIPKKKINPYFFYFLFSKEKIRIKGLSSSTSLSAINFTSLKALKIVVPQNTDEQQKIANCLFSLDELIEATFRKVEILKEHKKGLMQQLFPKI